MKIRNHGACRRRRSEKLPFSFADGCTQFDNFGRGAGWGRRGGKYPNSLDISNSRGSSKLRPFRMRTLQKHTHTAVSTCVTFCEGHRSHQRLFSLGIRHYFPGASVSLTLSCPSFLLLYAPKRGLCVKASTGSGRVRFSLKEAVQGFALGLRPCVSIVSIRGCLALLIDLAQARPWI